MTIGKLSLVLLALACPTSFLSAQPMVVEKKVITSQAARKIVDGCFAAGIKYDNPIAVAVVDDAGNLLEFHTDQGASVTTIETALLKAKTAARWRRSTQDLYDRVTKGINQAPLWTHDFPMPGGLPLLDGGQVIGAVAIGGTSDEKCLRVGVESVLGAAAIGGPR